MIVYKRSHGDLIPHINNFLLSLNLTVKTKESEMKIKVSKVHLQVLGGHSFFTPFRDIINTRMVGKICFTIRPFNISRVSEDLHNKQQNKEVRRDTDQQKAV